MALILAAFRVDTPMLRGGNPDTYARARRHWALSLASSPHRYHVGGQLSKFLFWARTARSGTSNRASQGLRDYRLIVGRLPRPSLHLRSSGHERRRKPAVRAADRRSDFSPGWFCIAGRWFGLRLSRFGGDLVTFLPWGGTQVGRLGLGAG